MSSIYQVKVTLLNTKPSIWRRVLTHSNISLAEFHNILQIVMPWENYHLHEFQLDENRYGIPDPDTPQPSEMDCADDRTVLLPELLDGEGAEAKYVYDFGDWWEHSLLLERIAEPEAGTTYPVCTEGERRCPPEDVGGPYGYDEFLDAVRDKSHERHEEMVQWGGRKFDPDAFPLESINKKLSKIGRARKSSPKVN